MLPQSSLKTVVVRFSETLINLYQKVVLFKWKAHTMPNVGLCPAESCLTHGNWMSFLVSTVLRPSRSWGWTAQVSAPCRHRCATHALASRVCKCSRTPRRHTCISYRFQTHFLLLSSFYTCFILFSFFFLHLLLLILFLHLPLLQFSSTSSFFPPLPSLSSL